MKDRNGVIRSRPAWRSSPSAVGAVVLAVVLVLPVAPFVPAGPARAQENVPAPPEAVWRTLSQNWFDTWGVDEGFQSDVTDVSFPTPQVGFAALSTKGGIGGERGAVIPSLLFTEDAGDHWDLILRGHMLVGVSALDDRLISAVSSTMVASTSDGGRRWVETSRPDQAGNLQDVAYAARGESAGASTAAVVVGHDGAVMRSVDHGQTWDAPVKLPPGSTEWDLNAVAFASPDDAGRVVGVAVGASGVLLATIDAGATWKRLEPDSLGSADLNDVAIARDGDELLAVAVGEGGALWRSTNPVEEGEWSAADGVEDVPSNAPRAMTGVALTGTDDGFAGYAVGGNATSAQRATVLALQDQDGDSWTPEPVDPRRPGVPRKDAEQGLAIINQLAANGVPTTVAAMGDESGQLTAVAGGTFSLLVKRTPIDQAEALAEDQWWQCLPGDPFENQSEVNDAISDAVSDNAGEERICPARGDRVGSSAGDPGPTRASECEVEDEAAEFPCLATWDPAIGRDSDGQVIRANNAPDSLFLDEDIGGQRRIVGVGGETATAASHLFLFDPDSLVQRGVPGFGHEWPGVSGESGVANGVVRLADAPRPEDVDPTQEWPPDGLGSSSRHQAYDEMGNIVFLGTQTSDRLEDPPRVVAISLTGEFSPFYREIPPLVDPDAPGRTQSVLRDLAFDATHGMLYALTETTYRDKGPLSVQGTDSQQVTLHAYTKETSSGALVLERAWSLGLEDRCRTRKGTLNYFGVSPAGDSLSFACAGHAGPHFGSPAFEPNQVVTVRLRLRGRHPANLDPLSPLDVAVSYQSIAGRVLNEDSVSFGVDDRSTLFWNQQQDGAFLWDFDVGGWIGALPFTGIGGAAVGFGTGTEPGDVVRPWRGRLYLTCSICVDFREKGGPEDQVEADEDALLVVDTLNVPAQIPAKVTETVRVRPHGAPKLVIPPQNDGEAPRLLMADGASIHVLEDRVATVGSQVRPDPDLFTHPEVPEDEASEVTRIGRASGYGTRVWWTGLGTAATPACNSTLPDPPPCEPSLSYEWLRDRDSMLFEFGWPGELVAAVPGLPGARTRELRLGAVQETTLENTLSQAQATGVFYDGGPADNEAGTTGEDVHRRRARDLHRLVDGEIDAFNEAICDSLVSLGGAPEQCHSGFQDFHDGFDPNHHGDPDDEDDRGFDGQFGPYEAAFDELVDRGMREVDGDRQVQDACQSEAPAWTEPADDPETEEIEGDDPDTWENEADCWDEFDRRDPRCRDDEGNVDCSRRSSVAEEVGLTWPSGCSEPRGTQSGSSGSSARCRLGEDAFGRTSASAGLGAFSLTPDDAETPGFLEGLSVGASGSATKVFRHEKLGMVVETDAWARDVTLEVAGSGSLQIGEVRSHARAWAKGVPDSADSELEVSFADVVIADEEGTRFACGRSHPDAGPPAVDPANPPSDQPEFEAFADVNDDGKHDQGDLLWAGGLTPDSRYGDATVACDPHRVADAISGAFAGKVQATTAAADDDEKTTGSPGGAQAIVQRNPVAALSDFVINRIKLQFDLPALQLTVFNDGIRANRMQIDLAAVYAETHYEIGQRRTELPELPASIDVNLEDPAGSPLADGRFTLMADSNGNGQAGGSEPAVGECTTDVSGTCGFDGLDAGAYVVVQTNAPVGYLPAEAPRSVFVSGGDSQTAEFMNLPDSAAVEVALVDTSGRPLAGGEFAMVPDLDGDGTVAPSDAMAASCATDDSGTCRFDRVSLGSWVLHQAAAPGGYQTADDVAFALQRPGQVARIQVVNGPAVASATLEIIEIIEGVEPASSSPDLPWWAAIPKTASLLLRNWRQALLFALTGILFGAPAYLAHRRRELELAKQQRP